MTKKVKTDLLDKGMRALKIHEDFFEECLQKADFDSAEYWRSCYDGAVFMLECLGLFSKEESKTLSEGLFARYKKARFPGFPKEVS